VFYLLLRLENCFCILDTSPVSDTADPCSPQINGSKENAIEKTHTCSVLPVLGSFFPSSCPTSAKDMSLFSKSQILMLSLKLSTLTFTLLLGTISLRRQLFTPGNHTELTESISTSTEL
jgi:hypothetical protein